MTDDRAYYGETGDRVQAMAGGTSVWITAKDRREGPSTTFHLSEQQAAEIVTVLNGWLCNRAAAYDRKDVVDAMHAACQPPLAVIGQGECAREIKG